ncbi:hypothetical protein FRC08_001962 [Ceratobasidium sp. 394]|nr:hypothetical protein FRC08_001962 [Ceratobasidium sp. 394]
MSDSYRQWNEPYLQRQPAASTSAGWSQSSFMFGRKSNSDGATLISPGGSRGARAGVRPTVGMPQSFREPGVTVKRKRDIDIEVIEGGEPGNNKRIQIAHRESHSNVSIAPRGLDVGSRMTTMIGKATPLFRVVSLLIRHGCQDITQELDLSTCSEYPVSSGGFGDVFKGRLTDGSPIAIKCMRIIVNPYADGDQKHLKAAAREIYAWSKLQHRYIARFLGLAYFRGQIAMISPWAEHGSLPVYLARRHRINRPLLCARIAEGLAFLHQYGVVHGDLKGANVLISDAYEPLLADFGNAQLRERSLQFTYTTYGGNLSPRWTAPELLDEGSYSVKADVYALGMTVLEVITGQVPYAGSSDIQVITAILNRRHPKRPEVYIPTESENGNTLWSVLTHCWEFNPGLRPSAKYVQDMMSFITPQGLLPRAREGATTSIFHDLFMM